MYRKQEEYLKTWKDRANRRPLIVRGARQIGKTYLIRKFGKNEFRNIVEYNFDFEPEKAKIFNNTNIEDIINLIVMDKKVKIIPGKTLIFLDEIQAAPEIIAKLRYFYEQKAELHIIAAGSLLDFTLADHEYSMPVGRIEYLFMGPMTYSEFLIANNDTALLDYLKDYSVKQEFPESIHEKCLKYLRHFFFTGGMPSPISAYKTGDLDSVMFEKKIILQTFLDDFSKYKKRVNTDRIKIVFNKVSQLIGQRIKYVNISPHEKAKDLSLALNLLSMAKITHHIHHSSCNGIPLEAELDEKIFKIIFLDIGLVLSMLNLNLLNIESGDDVMLVNEGALAEQFIGQHLLFHQKPYEEPKLFFWNRAKKGATSELDYVIENQNVVVPVEVKAGKTGTLKSLQVFVSQKKPKIAVRFNTDRPSVIKTNTAIPQIEKTEYSLLSLPLYMVNELPRILKGL
jgi:uncharacterized protein